MFNNAGTSSKVVEYDINSKLRGSSYGQEKSTPVYRLWHGIRFKIREYATD